MEHLVGYFLKFIRIEEKLKKPVTAYLYPEFRRRKNKVLSTFAEDNNKKIR